MSTNTHLAEALAIADGLTEAANQCNELQQVLATRLRVGAMTIRYLVRRLDEKANEERLP